MSLIENFKDRVPTEVLENGAIRYEQFDSQGNSLGYVYMLRADEPSEVGNKWNKVVYDGIKNEIGLKLYTSQKATQSEAELGEDDTKYMTPLKVSQLLDFGRGVQYTGIDLSSSSNNTINLNNYLTNKVRKLDVVINCQFRSSFTKININGTKISLINTGKISSGATSIDVGEVSFAYGTILKISIIPQEHCFYVNGFIRSASTASGGQTTRVDVVEQGTFESLSSIVVGRKDDDNYPTQVGIYQYMK